MAWSWSHTAEAYEAVRLNILDLPRDTLQIIWAEWRGSEYEDWSGWQFDNEAYEAALAEADNLPGDVLAEEIYERAYGNSTCDNGGWNAWVCPFGCHTVPFDRDNAEEEA